MNTIWSVAAIGLLVVYSASFSRCSSAEVDSNNALPTVGDSVHLKGKYLIPRGDEILVEVKKQRRHELLITVNNQSGGDVFVPFLPGTNSEYAFFAHVGLEKQSTAGIFESVEHSDFGTGLNVLKPGERFKYLWKVLESGVYRVNIKYSIDSSLVERVNKAATLEVPNEEWKREYEEINMAITSACAVVSSNPIQL